MDPAPELNPTSPAIKPGWATTEFWTTVGVAVSGVAGVAVVLLAVPPDRAEGIYAALGAVVTALGVIATVAWKFIEARRSVKEAAITADAAKVVAQATAPPNAAPLAMKRELPGARRVDPSLLITPPADPAHAGPDPYAREGDV